MAKLQLLAEQLLAEQLLTEQLLSEKEDLSTVPVRSKCFSLLRNKVVGKITNIVSS